MSSWIYILEMPGKPAFDNGKSFAFYLPPHKDDHVKMVAWIPKVRVMRQNMHFASVRIEVNEFSKDSAETFEVGVTAYDRSMGFNQGGMYLNRKPMRVDAFVGKYNLVCERSQHQPPRAA
jgi:hypothetical protein